MTRRHSGGEQRISKKGEAGEGAGGVLKTSNLVGFRESENFVMSAKKKLQNDLLRRVRGLFLGKNEESYHVISIRRKTNENLDIEIRYLE